MESKFHASISNTLVFSLAFCYDEMKLLDFLRGQAHGRSHIYVGETKEEAKDPSWLVCVVPVSGD